MEIPLKISLQISTQSASKKQRREYHLSINDLPDDVLSSILCHMSMKEAARTSVLSRRWEKLWIKDSCLNFDDSETLRNIPYRSEEYLELEQFKYINWVNNVLESCHIPDLVEFKIRVHLDESFQSAIDRWVRFALKKKVKIFELDFSSPRRLFQDSCYELRSRTLCFHSHVSITSITLKRVRFSGEVLEKLISNSPFLERLCIDCLRPLVHLRGAGPLLCLTYLEINNIGNMQSLELDAPNLLSLKYSGPDMNLFSVKVLNLAELCVGGTYVVTCIHHYRWPLDPTFAFTLKKLVLTLSSQVDLKRMWRLPPLVLSHLEQLELRVSVRDDLSLLSLSMLIYSSPSLNRLSLELKWLKPRIKMDVIAKEERRHYNLKVVEISGFVGQRVDTEFCVYLIENADMLKKMSITIDPFTRYDEDKNYKPEKIKAAREKAEHLRSTYGLKDKLVIL